MSMRKVVVVDFDGTLISRNSFEEFYKRLAIYALAHFRISLFGFMLKQVVLRKFRIIQHAELKRRLLSFLADIDIQYFLDKYAVFLKHCTNSAVMRTVNEYSKNGYVIVLSSAAPALYVDLYVQMCEVAINTVIATPSFVDKTWRENFGEEKKMNTLRVLTTNKQELSVFITDHEDDLPLLLVEKDKNLIVGESKRLFSLLKEHNCKFDRLAM